MKRKWLNINIKIPSFSSTSGTVHILGYLIHGPFVMIKKYK